MLKLGDWNELKITRFTEHGAYLDGGAVGELLMPQSYVSPGLCEGDTVRVFVYLDQQERLVGTTETPLAKVGDFAYLRVAWVNQYGAFLDWGLMKDLFVPFREQKQRMERGKSYVVYVYEDLETRRIVATAKVEQWLRPAPAGSYRRGSEVDVLIQHKTPLGFKVIVDNAYAGMVYDNQVFESLHTGDRAHGTVVALRPDGRIDVSLQRLGADRFRDFASRLMDELQQAGGELPFSDESSPEAIAGRFGVSKKTFKRALGTLYRQRLVQLDKGKIFLIGQE